MSKKDKEVGQHPAEYEQWKAQFKTVYTIRCTDEDGAEQVMYLKKPAYELKKQCVLTLMKNPDNVIIVGEMILAGCFIGGYNMNENEDLRLEAALQASNIIQMNDTVELKKS